MKSIQTLAKRALARQMSKRGQIIDGVTGTVIGVLVLILVLFAVLFAVSTLNPASFFTSGSLEYNATDELTKNFTAGASTFGKYIVPIMSILGMLIVLGAIIFLIVYLRRSQLGGGGSSIGL